MFKKIFFCVVVLSISTIALFTFIGQENHKHSPFIGVRTYDTTPIRIEMGKYFYEIPANYFDMQPQFNCNSEGELLVALLPNFEGRSKENNAKFSNARDDSDFTMILIDNAGKHGEGWTAQQSLEVVHRVHVVDRYKNNQIEKKVANAELGLDAYYEKNNFGRDVFTSQTQDGKLRTVIDCDAEKPDLSPGCGHYFVDEDLLVDFSYKRRYLKDWKILEANARQWLASMRTQAVTQHSPSCKN